MILCSASEPQCSPALLGQPRRGTWKLAPLRLVSKRIFSHRATGFLKRSAHTNDSKILLFVILPVSCVNLWNLPVVNASTDLLNQRHALHKNYTRYGYRCISRSG